MSHSSDYTNYSSSFEKFTASTDAKESIAAILIDLAKETGAESLLDLGAGDGVLTGYLSSYFREITAVDKKPEFVKRLADIPKVQAQESQIEDYEPTRTYDMILLSYSFTGIPVDKIADTLKRLTNAKSEDGRIIVVTFQDGCDWDLFSSHVYSQIGIARSGGSNLHEKLIQKAGFQPSLVDSTKTYMWGDSLSDLAEMMSFFFVKEEDKYRADITNYTEHLKQLSTDLPNGRRAISAIEDFIEITK